MKTTKEQRKEQAIKLMQKLDIYKPYINGFKQGDKVCFFENFAGFWVYQEPEIEKKMKEIEKEYNCTVFAITHEYTGIGEFYDFLIVSEDDEDWDYLVQDYQNDYSAYAYVWNKNDDWCSEFGDIVIKRFGGGIKRIG